MIRCCKCKKTYEIKFYEGESKRTLILCPHCGFQHSVDFKAVDSEKLNPIKELKLAEKDPDLEVSRILNSSRVAQAADDTDVTDWNQANEFIVAIQVDEATGPWTANYKLQWSDITDGSAYVDLASTGELAWGTGTDLANGTAVVVGEKACTNTPAGSGWNDGVEVEGATETGSYVLADEEYTEFHFAVNPSGANASHKYGFRLYDATNSTVVGTALAEVTMAANNPPTVALNTPAPAAKILDATPTVEFTGTDPNGDSVRYNIQIDTVNTFDSLLGDISLATYVSDDYVVTSGEDTVHGLWFNSDGTKMFVLGSTNEDVLRYSLSPAWDVSSATFDTGQTLDTSAVDTSPRGMAFSSDGYSIYICGNSNNKIFQWKLSTAWDLSTGSFTANDDVASQDATPRDIHFNSDGTKMILVGGDGVKAYSYTLSTGWDITTASYDSKYYDLSGSLDAPTGVWLNSAGTKMYVGDDDIGGTTWYVREYTLSTAWDITTANYIDKYLNITTNTPECSGLFFQPDNSHFYIAATDTYTITKYATTDVPLIDKVSGTDDGFANVDTPADDEPYNSGDKCDYDVQDAEDSYGEGNVDDSVSLISPVISTGQAFTVESNLPAISVKLYLKKVGTISGNLNLYIAGIGGTYGTNATPAGANLASASRLASVLTTSYQLIEFTFASPVTLGKGKYSLRLDHTGSAGNCVIVGADGSSPSHDGNYFYHSGGWVGSNTKDVSFYVSTELPLDTYYWRVKGKDPTGSDTYGAWATIRSFSVVETKTKTVTAKAKIGVATKTKTVTAKASIDKNKRYWVGNGGNWNDTSQWSLTSGGSSGAPVPTSADDVYFNANSFNTGSQSVTMNASGSCRSFDWTGVTDSPAFVATDYGISTHGDVVLSASMDISQWTRDVMIYTRSSATININFAGLTKPCTTGSASPPGINVYGTGRASDTVLLDGNITTTGDRGNFTVTDVTSFNTQNKTFNLSKALNLDDDTSGTYELGTSTIDALEFESGTLGATSTLNASSSTINVQIFDFEDGNSFGTVNFSGTLGTNPNFGFVTKSVTIDTLNILQNAHAFIDGGTTINITTAFTADGSGGAIDLVKGTNGTSWTISKSSGTVTVYNCNIENSVATGGASFFAVGGSTDGGGNSGWTFVLSKSILAKAWIDGYTEIIRDISKSSDDAFEYVGDIATIDSVNIRFGYRTDTSKSCTAGFRFEKIVIPQGISIVSAYLKVIAYQNESFSGVDVRIKAQDVDDATTFDTGTESPEDKTPLTDNYTDWTLPSSITGGQTYTSPDLKSVIQEIINRGSWASGNDVNIIVKDNSATNCYNFRSYDYSPSGNQAILEITFSILKSATIQAKANIAIGVTTETKTITAKTNIKKTQEKTVTAKADIKLTEEKTITAKARVEIGGITKTVDAKSNLKKTFDKTIQAKTRIEKEFEKTIVAKARIEIEIDQTIQAKANIQKTQSKTIQAKARIAVGGITKTVTAKSSIKKSESKEITTKARIERIETKTITAKAGIKATVPRTIITKARIEREITKTILAKADIFSTQEKTVTTKGRIMQGGITKALDAKAKIQVSEEFNVTAKARIERVESNYISAKARIITINEKEILAKANIKATQGKTVTAKGNIKKTFDKTVTAKGSIKQVREKTVTAKSRIQQTESKEIIAKGRIQVGGVTRTVLAKGDIKKSFEKTVTAKTNIKKGFDKTIVAKSRISKIEENTVDAKAKIKATQEKIITAKAKIQVGGISKTVDAKANIWATQEVTILVKARISIGVTKTLTAKSAIKKTSSSSISAKSKIKKSEEVDIIAKSRIEKLEEITVQAKAKIKVFQEKSITAKSRIGVGEIIKTVDVKSNIKATIEFDVDAKAKIQKTVEKSITAKADIKRTEEKEVTAKSNLQKTQNKTVESKARVNIGGITKDVNAKANIQKTEQKTIDTKADIKKTFDKTIQAKARLKRTEDKSIDTKARIEKEEEVTVNAKARIKVLEEVIISALANIKVTQEKTVDTKARIEIGGITKSVEAKADIKVTQEKDISAKARIEKENETTIIAKCRIEVGGVIKTVTAKGRIEIKDITKMIESKARVSVVESKDITAKALVKKIITESVLALADIKVTTDRTIEAKARIGATGGKTIDAKADIKKLGVEKLVQARARIEILGEQEIDAKARIEKTETREILAKGSISVGGATKTILGKSNIKKEVERQISAKAKIIKAEVTKTVDVKAEIVDPFLVINQPIWNASSPINASGAVLVGQTFTAPMTMNVTKISLLLVGNASASGSFEVYIEELTGGVPNGNELGRKTIQATSVPLGSNWFDITFDDEVSLSNGSSYAIITDGSNMVNSVSWYAKTTNVYDGGNKIYYFSGVWNDVVTNDFTFRVFGLARIETTVSAKAKIKLIESKEVSAKANIKKIIECLVDSKANIKSIVSRDVQSKASISVEQETQITAKARIEVLESYVIDAKANIKVIVGKTITTKADIFQTTEKAVQAKAIIQHLREKTITAKARIIIAKVKHVTAKANISASTEKEISAKAKIAITKVKTISIRARIIVSGKIVTITAKAKIQTIKILDIIDNFPYNIDVRGIEIAKEHIIRVRSVHRNRQSGVKIIEAE